MTADEEGEHHWVSAGDPVVLLEMLPDQVGERTRRLFACACARALFPVLADCREVLDSIEAAERYADGLIRGTPLRAAYDRMVSLRNRAYATAMRSGMTSEEEKHRFEALTCASLACAHPASTDNTRLLVRTARSLGRGTRNERLLALLRDAFANPFRQASLSADVLAWQGGTVGKLAQAAYEERQLPAGTLDPALIAVLADALDDAGCSDDSILDHLRSPGPHVCGCWVVDLILAKP